MDEDDIKWLPIKDLATEEGADDLVNSPNMAPYVRLAMSTMSAVDAAPNLDEIAKLTLEKRYVWRVASALKWGFADFDGVSASADRDTLSAQDLAKVMDFIRVRRFSFAYF